MSLSILTDLRFNIGHAMPVLDGLNILICGIEQF